VTDPCHRAGGQEVIQNHHGQSAADPDGKQKVFEELGKDESACKK